MSTRATTINVTHDARQALQGFQVQAAALLGRRLNQGQALQIAVSIAGDELTSERVHQAAIATGVIQPDEEKNL